MGCSLPVSAAFSSVRQSTPLLSCLNTWEYVLQLPGDVLVPIVFRALPPSADERTSRWERARAGRKLDKEGREAGSTLSQAPSFLSSDCPFNTTARLPLAMTSTGPRCWPRDSKANFCCGLVNEATLSCVIFTLTTEGSRVTGSFLQVELKA